MERYRLMEMLNFTASEIHKQIGALFNPKMTPEMKEVQLAYVERRLRTRMELRHRTQYPGGADFRVAEAYLITHISRERLQAPVLPPSADPSAFRSPRAA